LTHKTILAGYCIFNEAVHIGKSIESIYDHVDRIIVIDGPYIGFPHNSLKSTDGTREIVRSFGSKVELVDIPFPLEQWAKRSMMFGYKADWYFWIDGDEIAVGDVGEGMDFVRRSKDEVLRVKMRLWNPPSNPAEWCIESIRQKGYYEVAYPKFFRWQPGLHFSGYHNVVRDINRRLISPRGGFKTVPGFVLENRDFERPIEWELKKQQYLRFKSAHSGKHFAFEYC